MTNEKTAELRKKATQQARDFLAHDTEYQLGFLEVEQPNPLTQGLGEIAQSDTRKAVQMIFQVDAALAETFSSVSKGTAYKSFLDHVKKTIFMGGRLILSGCGATGRLCLNLEASWRKAVQGLQQQFPVHRAYLNALEDQVVTIMTGGDYALIKSVEHFEDCEELGRWQVKTLHLGPGDLLIGITATAETTSILGTASEACALGAGVEMLVCSDPRVVCARLKRVARVFAHPQVHTVYIPCGGLAVTGSTRMQSATIEQLVCGCAMQEALNYVLAQQGLKDSKPIDYSACFTRLLQQIQEDSLIQKISDYAAKEARLYQAGGKLTYFAQDFLLDVLSDTTERSPTFMIPPFRPFGCEAQEASWAFVKNPSCQTPVAWTHCLARLPRCLDGNGAYTFMQVSDPSLPHIALEDLLRFQIGNEPDPDRENARAYMAVWVGQHAAPQSFYDRLSPDTTIESLTLDELKLQFERTTMKLFEHIAMKMILNTISTVSMGCLGRLTSNFMTWMDMSNKKLVDRSARLIMQECGVSYIKALEELYYSKQVIDSDSSHLGKSPVQTAIRRLQKKNSVYKSQDL